MNPWKAWLPVTSDSLRCTKGEKYFTVFTLLSYTNYLIKNIGVHWLGGLCGRPSSEKPGFESIWKIDKKKLLKVMLCSNLKNDLEKLKWSERKKRVPTIRMTHHTTSQEESERECIRGIARSSCVWWTGWSANMWWIVRSECGCALDWAKNVCVGGTGGIARSACADASSFWSWPSSKHDDITTRKDRLPKHKKTCWQAHRADFSEPELFPTKLGLSLIIPTDVCTWARLILEKPVYLFLKDFYCEIEILSSRAL